jgi:hypothetical protein
MHGNMGSVSLFVLVWLLRTFTVMETGRLFTLSLEIDSFSLRGSFG